MYKLVKALEMKMLGKPVSHWVPTDPSKLDTDEDDGGWSIFVQITTSHIAVHAWPLRRAFMMDIFSCKPFSLSRAELLVKEELGVERDRCSVHYIDRSQSY